MARDVKKKHGFFLKKSAWLLVFSYLKYLAHDPPLCLAA